MSRVSFHVAGTPEDLASDLSGHFLRIVQVDVVPALQRCRVCGEQSGRFVIINGEYV